MTRGPCTFKQRDVTQALKAAVAAGLRVARIEIDRQGKIAVFAASDDTSAPHPMGKLQNWEDVR